MLPKRLSQRATLFWKLSERSRSVGQFLLVRQVIFDTYRDIETSKKNKLFQKSLESRSIVNIIFQRNRPIPSLSTIQFPCVSLISQPPLFIRQNYNDNIF